MLRVNISAAKIVFVLFFIVVSFMSSALIHVYAGSGEDSANSTTAAVLPAVATGSAPGPAAQTTVDVCPGDTLWNIAAAHLPEDESIRSYIYKLKKANSLKNSDIKAGQVLILP